MQAKIKEQLLELAEEDYRVFASGLLPNTHNLLGVRLPLLRKMAKRLAKEDWQAYLYTGGDDFFEEIMLQGMVIGCAKCSPEERMQAIQCFVPKIDNWSVCDSFCAGLKLARENPEEVWDFLAPYFNSQQEFELRFAVVMLIFYYINESYLEQTLNLLDAVSHEGYYVKMAVAWAVSICYIQFPEHTGHYLERCALDDFTYNKALQKITESLKISPETKVKIRSMKRKI
ncbi:DNA alkylation repair protein [Oscillospiraceae bacterium MB08-C2-2]|nr:DNA alkylation repair protein [Oscillospiraceae bacterium MB08-C2-2]